MWRLRVRGVLVRRSATTTSQPMHTDGCAPGKSPLRLCARGARLRGAQRPCVRQFPVLSQHTSLPSGLGHMRFLSGNAGIGCQTRRKGSDFDAVID